MYSRRLMIAAFLCTMFTALTGYAETYVPDPSIRPRINIGFTPWKFTRGDPVGASTVAFNDAAWQTVGLPHTWGDTLSFLNSAAGGPGPGYDASTWYRNHFTLDNAYANKKIFVEFRGAGIGAAVYINGTFIPGNSAYNPNATHVIAFIPFIVDITPYVHFGGAENVLAVKVSSTGGIYSDPGFAVAFKYGMGCTGLFRPVYMHVTDKIYIPANVYSVVNNWGTYVAAVTATPASADVRILTHVKNESGAAASVTLTTKIVDAAHTVVWTEDKTQSIPTDSAFVFDQTATVTNPTLWYPANSIYGKPYLYRVYHIVKVGAKTVDVFESPLGIRVITWNADFPVINGHPHYLWGGASRYDYPALGCAQTEEQQWRDAKLMADCGGSFWRPGHATASGEFTEACDQFGVMLMQPSGDIEGTLNNPSAYQAGLKKEVHRDMIIRDRNNPSILGWEVSNGPFNVALENEIRSTIDSVWDPIHTRAMSDRGYWNAIPQFNAGVVSTISCSYTGCEIAFHQQYPAIPSWGAEAWSGSRGFRFEYDNELTYANEYVQNWKNSKKAKCFAIAHWYMAETPGETGVGRSFGTSMMDWSRIPKMLYWIYQACWMNYSVKPVVHLAHHWNRSGNITVNAFSNCPSVRLRINGADQGTKVPFPDSTNSNTLMPRQCQWNVAWAAGTVRAEGLDAGGNVVCFDEKKTAGAPACVALTVEPPIVKPCDGDTFKIYANGSDAAFILATVVDANGNWCPTSQPNVTFSVSSGPGNYRGGADNNSTSGQNQFYHSPGSRELTAEGGMCKVAVRSTFVPGAVTVTATSPGLCDGTATFTTVAVPPPPPVSAQYRPAFVPKSAPVDVQMRMIGRTLKYFLNVPAEVSFYVLDASGKVVRRVERSGQTEGWHALKLGDGVNGSIGGGVYFVKCSVEQGSSFVKRMIVLR
jgi:beta-galactosidase